jgi:hypothetical protein
LFKKAPDRNKDVCFLQQPGADFFVLKQIGDTNKAGLNKVNILASLPFLEDVSSLLEFTGL